MSRSTALLILLLAVPAVYATDYTVGDSNGWTTNVDYTTWASGKTFTVGDKLVFTYGATHSLDQVSKSDYDSCTSGNALKTYSGGSNSITLPSAGSFYFLCPTFGHCGQGMKLAITVSAAGTPSTPTTPSTPSTPSSPGTPPATSTPSTPPPPGKSGAQGSLSYTSGLLLGASLLMAPLIGLMG